MTGTVLAAMEFRDFLCARYDVTPPNLQEQAMVDLSPSMYVTDLVKAMAASSLHITTKCMTISCTS